MFCLILLCKMRQNIVHLKLSFAAEGGGILFTQPYTYKIWYTSSWRGHFCPYFFQEILKKSECFLPLHKLWDPIMKQLHLTLLIVLLLTSGASCKKDTDATAKMLLGRWELQEGFRNRQPSESLAGLFFEFGKEGKMSTNLPLTDIAAQATFSADPEKILQRQGEMEVEYQIETLNDSLLIVNTKLRNYDFRFVLKKK